MMLNLSKARMMLNMSKASLCVATGALSLLGVASPATAAPLQEVTLVSSEIDEGTAMLTDQYRQLALSEEQLEVVLSVWGQTGYLQAMDPASEPVNSEERVLVADGSLGVEGSPTHIDWFADGSIRTQTIEQAQEVNPSSVANRSVQGCTVYSGSGVRTFTNCSVTNMWGTIQIGYLASFEVVSGAAERISWAGNGWQRCGGVACTAPAVSIFRAVEFGDAPATVRGTSDVTAPWGSWQVWTELQVGGDTYRQTSS